jgi:hypothetical protein
VGSLTSFLSSSRLNRVLFWVGAIVLAAGVTVFIVKVAGNNDSSSTAANVDLNSNLAQNRPAANQLKQKPAKIDPAARQVAGKFILTAVARKNLVESWKYVSPSLKQGYTLREWKTGNLPVVPYPVQGLDQARFRVTYQQPKELDMQVALIPKKGVKVDATTFQIVLVKRGAGANARWLVDYWMPVWSAPLPNAPGGGGSN